MLILETGLRKLNKSTFSGFTLIEVLVALGIVAFVMSSALKIFSSNAIVVNKLEEIAMSRFVADNVLVSTVFFSDELSFGRGTESQGGVEYFWERNVTFGEEGKSAQINITISNRSGKELYTLHGYKVIE